MKTEYKYLNVDIRDNVALISMNNPPVNQLSEGFGEELVGSILDGLENREIKALILTGTGKNFIAGADIKMIYTVKDRKEVFDRALDMARFIGQIETSPKPVIAAINGNALGGGLEMAMGCHYRLASKGVMLGQPEVQIGVIPGAGGTQRLPRLIGLPNAIEMMTTGAPIRAEVAEERGLVDAVVEHDELIDKAFSSADRFISGELQLDFYRTRNKVERLPSAEEKKAVLAVARKMTSEKAKGFIAPFKVLDAIEKGLSYDIEADIEKEVELFSECAVSSIAKNLMGIFINTRAAGKLTSIQGIEPAKIKKVAMLGGGVMGSGIVNLLLSHGFDGILWDINDEAIQKGIEAVRKSFAYHIKTRKMTEKDLDQLIREHLTTSTSLQDISDADLVIEAVLEDMDVKQGIWKELLGICREDVVFATNTSALPITDMATVLDDPSRMIGLHFFNPAHRMQLLEIICADKTSDETLATSVAFARAIRKIPIVVNDGPGFYVSRQLGALMGGLIPLLAEGVSLKTVEEAMVEFGMPMGPATLNDLTGIDINYHVGKTFERTMGERYKMHPLLEPIYKAGCYGRKTGSGWYDYSGDEPVLNPKLMSVVQKYLEDNNVSPKEMSQQEIIDLMLGNAINEAAYMIQEGICDRPQDMDLAMIYGTGFPTYRGGILRYADEWGINNVYEYLVKQEGEQGAKFKPAALLKDMAESGQSFYKE
ncbi:3-hydroxyacyl-CoA dehydrogenase NAD-binding domain-containing protein [Thermodesulfobacteriota bacterium]